MGLPNGHWGLLFVGGVALDLEWPIWVAWAVVGLVCMERSKKLNNDRYHNYRYVIVKPPFMHPF